MKAVKAFASPCNIAKKCNLTLAMSPACHNKVKAPCLSIDHTGTFYD